jgi:carbamoyl-phosphate synthase large subunit
MDKQIRVLITGAGAPGIAGTIYSLRNNYNKRKFYIITTDIKSDVPGKYLSDDFYVIPPAIQKEMYLEALYKICHEEKVQIIIPQNTAELFILASSKKEFKKRGVSILLSDPKAIDVANNKYKLMQICKEHDIPVGKFYLVNHINNLRQRATELGWPDKKVVVKPPISNGMRGVRIIDEEIDLKESFYEQKPSSLMINMQNLNEVLGETFPDLIITEYLPGLEYSVDMFRSNDINLVIPRTRDEIRTGITFKGTVEYNSEIIKYSKMLAKKIDLKYCFGFQYKLDENGTPKILESNPRIQGTMVMSTLADANIIYAGVKALLNEPIEKMEVQWNTRFFRLWGGISSKDNQIRKITL